MIRGLQLCRDIGILLKFAEFLSEPLLRSCRRTQKIVRSLNLMSMIVIVRRVINQRDKGKEKIRVGNLQGLVKVLMMGIVSNPNTCVDPSIGWLRYQSGHDSKPD